MKKIILAVLLIFALPVFAEETQVQTVKPAVQIQNPLTTPQNIMFENCRKIFSISQEKLFYLTLSSISANRFNIDEIQTANGYVIFTANRNKYLATVAKIDNTNSILKITPCNNVYNFPPGILINMFKFIDMNMNTEIKM